MSEPTRVRVVVHGHVQGVFFRNTVCRAARERGVAGWVRNRPDASVEAVLEGAGDAVEALIDLCRRGPRGAQVERTEVHDEAPEGLSGFEVR